jgi:NAD(P)H-hydrate epimerase
MADAFCKTISSSVTVLQLAQLINHLPVRQPSSYKNQHGHVLMIGGDSGMGGAIRLASEACLRAGAGLVSVATHPTNVSAVLSGRYELMVQGVEKSAQLHELIKKANCVVVGPGLGQSSWGQMIWQSLLSTALPESMVIDADGLNFMAQGNMPNATNVVITPHLGEAARLLGCEKRDIELNRFNAVLKLVDKYNVVSLLKGPGSIICDGNQYQINLSGTPSMASAGMGDVLSGIIGAFLASRLSAFDAASLGAAIHGLAGEQAQVGGKRGMLAADLFPFIRQLVE